LNESRRQDDLSRKIDQRAAYDVNEDMQDPIIHAGPTSSSASRQNLKGQTLAGSEEQKDQATPEMEAALHSSYME